MPSFGEPLGTPRGGGHQNSKSEFLGHPEQELGPDHVASISTTVEASRASRVGFGVAGVGLRRQERVWQDVDDVWGSSFWRTETVTRGP